MRIGALLLIVLAVAATASAQPTPAPTLVARNLAENVLGPDSVKSVKLIDRGTGLAMVWEAATYRSTQTPRETREQLEGEITLATGAVLGVLRQMRRIQFTVVLGKRTLASGERDRQRIQITYAQELNR